MSAFFNKFRKDILGLAWLTLALLLALSLASFNPNDPSLNSTATAGAVSNFCGYVGSFLADLLLQIFGLAAWLLPVAATRVAWRSFREGKSSPQLVDWLIYLLLIVDISSVLALYMSVQKIYGQIYWGGALGAVLNIGLVKALNHIGVSLLLWSATLILLIYYSQKPLKDIFAQPVRAVLMFRDAIEQNIFTKVNSFFSFFRAQPAGPGMPAPEFMPITEKKISAKQPEVEQSLPQREQSFQIETPKDEIKQRRDAKEQAIKRLQHKIENWELPKPSLLDLPPAGSLRIDQRVITRNTQILEDKLAQFNIKGQVVAVRPGPAVTMFEFKPAADVKVSRITELADDLSLALSAESVRIIAPLPGRDVVGIETSNPKRETVYLRESLEDPSFWDEKNRLPLALGKQADGQTNVVDLRKMPHLLVAGTTGSGKSVFVVSTLTGLLFRHSPKTLRLILVDPKQVDLAAFHSIPHLIMPPVRETKKAVAALKWAVREMEKRYRSMVKFGARGLEAFNELVEQLPKNKLEEHEQAATRLEEGAPHEAYYYKTLPYLVIVVEEFGDLMAVDKNNVEPLVVRLAQMARACGIHLILAMQSPRRDVVTGLIKTNFPGRVSFKVASKTDSRIILDESGAERLLANGDMLFKFPGIGKIERHHGAWISESEIQRVTEFWSGQSQPEYDRVAMKMLEGTGGGYDFANDGEDGPTDDNEQDEMYDEILAWVSSQKDVSASLLQRKYRLGYPRAARMIEIFEREGVVGPANGSKPRQVLVSKL